jgi:integrase
LQLVVAVDPHGQEAAMAVMIRERKDRGGWYVFADHQGRRRAQKCGTGRAGERLAKQIKTKWEAHLALGQLDQVFVPKVAMAPVVPSVFPTLRDAVTEWIERQEQGRDIRGATPIVYLGRCKTWVFDHALPDGRRLGDLPVNVVTREMIGEVIKKVKAAGRSISTIEHIRNPLRGCYRDLIETKAFAGPNPAGDLGFFIGRMRRGKRREFFTTDEAPKVLGAAKALYPFWHPFILTGFLAGLRWGETAGLFKTDIDFKRGRIHVQRSYSSKARALQPFPKDDDARFVKASPALLAALREQIEKVTLEGQVKNWDVEQKQLVFPSPEGRFLHDSRFYAIWKPLLAVAGVRYRNYHAVRHSYAVWMLENGTDPRWVQNQLGHASIAQTVDTYGDVIPDRHQDAVNKLDEYCG